MTSDFSADMNEYLPLREVVFNTLRQAILKGEPTTVVSFTMVLIIVYIFANLLVDLIYALLDPRIRYV